MLHQERRGGDGGPVLLGHGIGAGDDLAVDAPVGVRHLAGRVRRRHGEERGGVDLHRHDPLQLPADAPWRLLRRGSFRSGRRHGEDGLVHDEAADGAGIDPFRSDIGVGRLGRRHAGGDEAGVNFRDGDLGGGGGGDLPQGHAHGAERPGALAGGDQSEGAGVAVDHHLRELVGDGAASGRIAGEGHLHPVDVEGIEGHPPVTRALAAAGEQAVDGDGGGAVGGNHGDAGNGDGGFARIIVRIDEAGLGPGRAQGGESSVHLRPHPRARPFHEAEIAAG
ncbi:hypothetical protein ACI7BZ_20170 [Xanthobacter sp. AM11]|uniref:hypothetical protein n=1 Tax=Xanthobacter sp. AM11 TaxID=3380643 RepID=UPI0039BED350